MPDNHKQIIEDIYKSVLNKDNAFTKLQDFIKRAEEFNENQDEPDVVKGYIQCSGNCHELKELIKTLSTLSVKEAQILFDTLTCILLRTASDLTVHASIGMSIITETLNNSTKSMHNFVKLGQKASRIRCVLNLLASMIAHGVQAAQMVFSKVNIAVDNFTDLFGRSNPKQEEDIRSSFVNVIMLLLGVADNNLIRQVVDTKGFLNGMFPGLPYDRSAVIILVLETFLSKVINNNTIAKTSKIRLFNDFTLKYVVQLYVWTGPVKIRQGTKRKLGDAGEPQPLETEAKDIVSVRETAHKFMKALCCSFKNGIIFHDLSCGTSGRNQNHVVTNVLASFPNLYSNAYGYDLVLLVMKACPDQMKYFLPILEDMLVPRLSVPWLQAIGVMKKIIQSYDCVSYIFKTGDMKPLNKIVAIAKMICLPSIISVNQIVESFKTNHMFVCYHLLSYITCILKQVNSVLIYCSSSEAGNSVYKSVLKEFQGSFFMALKTSLPDVQHIQNYWFQITSASALNWDNNISDKIKEVLQDFGVPSYSMQLSQVLEVLKQYYTLHRHSSKSIDTAFGYLFTGLKACTQHLSSSEKCSLQLQLIDIFSDQDFLNTTVCPEGMGSSPLSLVLDIFLTVEEPTDLSKVTKLIYKLLKSYARFDGDEWEVDIWLKVLKSQDKSCHPQVVKILDETFHFVGRLESTAGNGNNVCVNRTFSILVPTVVACFDSHQYSDAVKTYIQTCITHIIHHQSNPRTLFSTLKDYKHLFCPKLYKYWKFLCGASKTCQVDDIDKLSRKCLTSQILRNAFIRFHSSTEESHFDRKVRNFQNVNQDEIPWLVWQLLLYMQFEITKLLKNERHRAAVSYYSELLQKLLDVYMEQKQEAVDSVNEGTEVELPFGSSVKTLLKDMLYHPSLRNYFLHPSLTKNDTDSAIVECMKAITNLVFHILKLKPLLSCPKDFEDVLCPYKDQAIAFCEYNINSKSTENDIGDFNCSVLQVTIESLSFIFTPADTSSLITILLSMDQELFRKIDSKCSFLILLLEVYQRHTTYVLLPIQIIKGLFSRFVHFEKKTKRLMTESIYMLFSKHPVYTLAIDGDDVTVLMKQQSRSSLKIFDLLITHNEILREFVKQTIVSFLSHPKHCKEYFFMHLVYLCFKEKFSSVKDVTFLHSVANFSWQFIKNVAKEITSDCPNFVNDIGNFLNKLKENGLVEERQIRKLIKKLRKDSKERIPSCSNIPFLSQLICSWKNSTTPNDVSPCETLLEMSINWIMGVARNIHCDELICFHPLLNFSCIFMKNAEFHVLKKVISDESMWLDFLQHILKVSLGNVTVGSTLILMLVDFFEKLHLQTDLMENSLKGSLSRKVHALVTSHSNFFNILLKDAKENKTLKENVVQLLITLVQVEPKLCQDVHVPLFLASYTATLSVADQKLLHLLKIYEGNGVDMSQFSPFLWGNAAISHYSVQKNVKMFLWKQPKMQEILGLFRSEILDFTSLNFPLELKLEPTNVNDQLFLKENGHQMYDPRFVLPLLAVLLSAGAYVNCRGFIDSKALGIVFGSLSSYDVSMRAIGYYCLSQFYSHLESSLYGQRKIWILLLDAMRNSIEKPNPRLPCIVTVFLAKAVDIVTRPTNPMYVAIYNFLSVKPNLDLDQIPEFYKLFNSTEIEHRLHRSWILTVIQEGLRGSLAFHICRKRYLFTILLPYYSSSLCAESDKIKILAILLAVVKIYSSARTFCQEGLLSWLHSVIKTSEDCSILRNLVDIMDMLWQTSCCGDQSHLCPETKEAVQKGRTGGSVYESSENGPSFNQSTAASESSKPRAFYLSFASEFSLVYFSLLEKMSFMDNKSLYIYLRTLKSILESNTNSIESESVVKRNLFSSLLFCHVEHLYKRWKLFGVQSSCGTETLYDTSHPDADVIPPNVSKTEIQNDALDTAFLEAIMFWHPRWNEIPCKEQYARELAGFIDVTLLIFQHLKDSDEHFDRFSKWIILCLENDCNEGLVKLLLSSDERGIRCFEAVLHIWEKKLRHSQDMCKYSAVSEKQYSYKWTSVIKLLKDKSNMGIASQYSSQILENLFLFLK